MTEKKPMRAELVDDYRIKCQLLLEEVIDAEEAAKLAAAEIAELRAERDRLKAALETVRQYVKGGPDHVSDDDITAVFSVVDAALRAAGDGR